MGKIFSRNSPKSEEIKLSSVQNTQQKEQYEIYDPEKYDIEAVENLRKEFRDDPELFISNMLLMSFMFFDDYEEEIRKLANTSIGNATKLNAQLIEHHQKQLLVPDAVMGSVNSKVKFRHTRGPKKGLMEPLVHQRMYIIHDTIEIEDKKDSVDYSRIDKPTYRADVEESKENKGYIKVKLLSGNGLSDKRSPSVNSASSSTTSTQERIDIGLLNKTSLENIPTEMDSGFNTGESEYGYSRITAATTPRKLNVAEKDIYTNIGQLPSNCVTPIKVKNIENLSDSDSDDEESNVPKRHLRELFKTHYYLNSAEFMAHFRNNVFPNYLGKILGFTEESIANATTLSAAIFCDTMDDSCDIIKWEIIPAIAMPWPDEIAFEWSLRRRKTVWDRREKKPIAYKWPTDLMVDEVNKLNCVVLPKGFMPKKGTNPNMNIEWEVGFPKAERYLEFRMYHAQIRIFIYLITLHKKFIETSTQKHGLLIEHIRSLMFWECEENYKAWPEDKLGTKLILVLKNLYNHLGRADSPQYFVRGQNILENVPRKYLIPAQDIIHRIIETPLLYFISALKHLKYTSEKFYPEPDLDELYRILRMDSAFYNEVHVSVLAFEKAKQEEDNKRRREEARNVKRDQGQKWNRRYLEQQRHANAKKLIQNNNEQNSKNLNKEQRRESVESIDFKLPIKKRFVNDIARQILLLTFFLQHFIQIAKKCMKLSSTGQTMFYLKQAWYLTKLLKDVDIENALHFQKIIKEEEEHCQKKRVTEQKIPVTPKRNSNVLTINDILPITVKDIDNSKLGKVYNKTGGSELPHTSGGKKKWKTMKHAESTPNLSESIEVELHNQSDIRYLSSKDITKSVSFLPQTSVEIMDEVEEDPNSITTL